MNVDLRLKEPPVTTTLASPYNVAMGYLRAFVTLLVVFHHAVLAYVGAPPPSHRFAGGAMLWRAFPVVDSQHWPLAGLIDGFNDVYFMALMFLLSGLFVWGSLTRKGTLSFARDRVLRLGIPFLFSACIVTPAAYYVAYLQSGGTPGLASYWNAWLAIGYWPTGPAWFVLLLLIFDVVAALLFVVLPNWGEKLGALSARAAEKPGRLFWLVVALSLLAYAPLAHIYGAGGWTYWGFLQFQSARPLHYFVYFVVGVGIGAYGLGRGLLSPSGTLARRWPLWVAAMIGAFMLGAGVFFAIIGSKGATQQVWIDVGSFTFALSCAASCFGLLALFTRFVKRANPVWDSLSRNAYGIYLVHYAFVAWLQYALLTAPFSGIAKALAVTAGALLLSWTAVALLRRIPAVARLV